MKKFFLAGSLLFFLFISKLQAQSCFSVSAGNDTTISCLQTCLDLHARIPDLRTSEDYRVVSIPYTPYAYTTPFGTTDPLVNADDHFSDSFALPFPFCFYGDTYAKIAVGSNGVITFDIKENANKQESYVIAPGDTIPYAFGVPDDPDTYYAPRASIFLAYVDLNPLTSPAGNKIEWRVEGVAPCRRFVVSYYHQRNYSPSCPPADLTTMQAVLYEGSGIIDVFYESKPFCTAYLGGLAIAGVQNWNRDKAVTPIGWNGTVWEAYNRGIRYIPSGAGSLLDSVVLFKNNVRVATGVATPLGNGEMDALFTNVCQSEDSMSYVVKAFYKQCDNPLIETEGSDTIIVYKTLNPLSINSTDAVCPTYNGQVTVTNPVGANIEYSIDNGITWQSSPVFNVPAGSYTVIARLVGSLCTGSGPATVTEPQPFSTNGVVTDVQCNGQSTGQVTFNPIGTNPFTYSKDAGATYQASNSFTGLAAGSYTFRIKNGVSCTQDTTIIITEPATGISATSSSTPASCRNNDGSITINANGGTPAYDYSIDGGATFSLANTFLDLPIGLYNLVVKDANGCSITLTETVLLNDTMRLELGPDTTICFGSSVTLMPQTNPLTDTFRWRPPVGLDYDTAQNPIARPTDTTKYYLLAKWGICQREDSITVNILHKPIALAGNDTTICYKSFAILNGSVANISGPVGYAWTPSSTVLPPNLPLAVATPGGTQQYVLTVQDNYGCNFTVSDSMWVIMQPSVPAFAGNDTNALLAKPHHMKATGGLSYLWSPAGPLDDPTLQKPTAILHNDTYFRVVVTDAIGCKGFDDVFIKVYEGPNYYLPNAFTPNGDGLNDKFFPVPVGMKSTDYFMVLNRFGETMFQTREWMKGWDGTIKGKPADQGTYVWIIKGRDENNQEMEKKGTVTLIR